MPEWIVVLFAVLGAVAALVAIIAGIVTFSRWAARRWQLRAPKFEVVWPDVVTFSSGSVGTDEWWPFAAVRFRKVNGAAAKDVRVVVPTGGADPWWQVPEAVEGTDYGFAVPLVEVESRNLPSGPVLLRRDPLPFVEGDVEVQVTWEKRNGKRSKPLIFTPGHTYL